MQHLVERDGKIAHAHAGGVEHGIGDGCSRSANPQLAEALDAKEVSFVVEAVEFGYVGVHWHQVFRHAPDQLGALGMDAQLGAEPPADIRADDVDPRCVDPQRAGDGVTYANEGLGADVDPQIITMPHRQAGVRLHRLGELIRRRVALVDFDRGSVEGDVEVAHRRVGLPHASQVLRSVRLVLAREVIVSRLDGVVDVDEIRRRPGLLEGRGDDKSHAKNVNATVITLDDAQRGYQEFDQGVPKKFVLDPHGVLGAT